MAHSKAPDLDKQISKLEGEIKTAIAEFNKLHDGCACYPLLIRQSTIGPRLVDTVYEELSDAAFQCDSGKLIVIIHSSGGDIDAAYNLASLLREIGSQRLEFVVPRWAKSAATLLCCAGDIIRMTRVAELGPMDPQITTLNPLEKRMEEFSPLHIESTFDLIREEYKKGNDKLADKLIERLQFPLTLGGYKKSLDIAKQYLERLLSTRMIKDDPAKAKAITKKLTEDYADHGFCINAKEAKDIGLTVETLHGDEERIVWKIHKLVIMKSKLESEKKKKEMEKKLRDLPPGVLDKLMGGSESHQGGKQ